MHRIIVTLLTAAVSGAGYTTLLMASEMESVGINPGMPYHEASEVLRARGWSPVDPASYESAPYQEHPEISCGDGRYGICSAGFQRHGKYLALIIGLQDGGLVVEGNY